MQAINLPTKFASAERDSPGEVASQAQHFLENSPLLCDVLNAIPDMVVLLNQARQIVFANSSLVALLGTDQERVWGLRPGEALNCTHASETAGGCGTTEYCSTCGAVRAILAGQQRQVSTQECRVWQRATGEALDLRVRAAPLDAYGTTYTVFTVSNICHEKRREALERIFFHDVLNTAGGLQEAAELARIVGPGQAGEVLDIMCRLTLRLVDEIRTQRQLSAAEDGELEVTLTAMDAGRLLRDIVALYINRDVAVGRHIVVRTPEPEATLISDATLLQRVLGNMLKNALEASRPGDMVTMGYGAGEGRIEFWVHNPASMPREVQLQVFQRSFSTKGPGRGLGTYSIKYLTEHYLQGQVGFSSSAEDGTVFRATYPLVRDANQCMCREGLR